MGNDIETNAQTVNGDQNLNGVFNDTDIVSTTMSVPSNNYKAQVFPKSLWKLRDRWGGTPTSLTRELVQPLGSCFWGINGGIRDETLVELMVPTMFVQIIGQAFDAKHWTSVFYIFDANKA